MASASLSSTGAAAWKEGGPSAGTAKERGAGGRKEPSSAASSLSIQARCSLRRSLCLRNSSARSDTFVRAVYLDGRDDRDLAVQLVKFDETVLEREERPITADADILARMVLCPALAN